MILDFDDEIVVALLLAEGVNIDYKLLLSVYKRRRGLCLRSDFVFYEKHGVSERVEQISGAEYEMPEIYIKRINALRRSGEGQVAKIVASEGMPLPFDVELVNVETVDNFYVWVVDSLLAGWLILDFSKKMDSIEAIDMYVAEGDSHNSFPKVCLLGKSHRRIEIVS